MCEGVKTVVEHLILSKEKLLEVCNRHKFMFTDLTNMDWTADEIFRALDFASDILDAVSKETEKAYPYATKAIERYRMVGYEIYEMGDESYEVLRDDEVDNEGVYPEFYAERNWENEA